MALAGDRPEEALMESMGVDRAELEWATGSMEAARAGQEWATGSMVAAR